MYQNTVTPREYANVAHQAANETLSISIGVHVLRTIPQENLTPAQVRALQHLEEASARLIDLIEIMKSAEPELMEQ